MIQLHALNQAHADRILADGGGWVFGAGRLTRNAARCLACDKTIESTHRHDYRTCGCPNGTMVDGGLDYRRWGAVVPEFVQDASEHGPPASFVEACQPCESEKPGGCGLGAPYERPRLDCPDCHDGRPRCELVVPCDGKCNGSGVVSDWEGSAIECPRCDGYGLITVASVVAVGEPLRVYDTGPMSDEDMDALDEAGDWIERDGQSLLWWHEDRKIDGSYCTNIRHRDIDPASLVGQWAQQIEVPP